MLSRIVEKAVCMLDILNVNVLSSDEELISISK